MGAPVERGSGSFGRPNFSFLGPERAALRIELETRLAGAGLELGFVVATAVETP